MPIPAEQPNPPAEPDTIDHGEHDAKVRHLHAVQPHLADVPEPHSTPEPEDNGEPAAAAPLTGLGTASPEVEDPTQPIPVVVDEAAPEPGQETSEGPGNAVAGWAKALCDPQSGLWHDRQPSLAEKWRYYRSGPQLPEHGALRKIGLVLGLISFAIHVVAETVKFMTNTIAKLAVTTTVVVLAWLWTALG